MRPRSQHKGKTSLGAPSERKRKEESRLRKNKSEKELTAKVAKKLTGKDNA